MKHILVGTIIVCALCAVSSIPAHAGKTLNLVGARPLYFGGLKEIAQLYENKTGIKIFSKAGGCSVARSDVKNPCEATIGAWCCPVPQEMDKRLGIVRIPVAMDAIVIYVHPSNPINNITIAQLRAIYRGTMVNWSEAGGPDRPIVALVRRHCEDIPEVFREQITGSWEHYENVADWLEVKSIEKMIENVEKFPLAIGYESSVFAKKDSVKILSVDGISPTAENIKTRRYPFWRELSLGILKQHINDPQMNGFLDFILSSEGQQILGRKLVAIPREVK